MSRFSKLPVGALIREQQNRAARKATELIARRWNDSLGIWLAVGYPKSGTTWLSRILADYLRLPSPTDYRLPVAMPAVIHCHWRYDDRFRRSFYIYRDGRDVMVSLYFHWMARLDNPKSPRFSRALREKYEGAMGAGFDPTDAVGNLPSFMQLEYERPRGSRINWTNHVGQWYRPGGRPGVAYVSFEELLTSPLTILTRGFEQLGHQPVDEESLQEAIDRHSFQRVAGRERGVEDRTSFFRKGVAGDWRNYFTAEAAEVFDRYYGDTLIALGYEPDRSWVTSTDWPARGL